MVVPMGAILLFQEYLNIYQAGAQGQGEGIGDE